MLIHAIYENGVFRPKEPVSLPVATEVILQAELSPIQPKKYAPVWAALSQAVDTGIPDLAERHHEHQP